MLPLGPCGKAITGSSAGHGVAQATFDRFDNQLRRSSIRGFVETPGVIKSAR
jgi:hypothetical protein